MNDNAPFDPLDRTLSDAFARVRVDTSARPSMHDVRARARRRHHRRTGATLGAMAVIGAGGAVAFAARDDGEVTLRGGDADLGTATTVPCVAVPTTVLLPTATTIGLLEYTVQEGDTPAGVAAAYGITVEQLDAANTGLADYASFAVGLAITVPTPNFPVPIGTTTTVDPRVAAADPCGVPSTWHCTGPLGTDEVGRAVFEYCEPSGAAGAATPTIAPEPTSAPPPFTGLPSTLPPTTSPVDAIITSSTVDPSALLASTTTSILEPTSTTATP